MARNWSGCWRAATSTPLSASSGCRFEARWVNLQNLATRPDIATLIDDAILAVESDNSNLKGKLPRDYARRGIAPERMKDLIDLFAGIGFKDDRASARDMLGRVYEYFLGKFAQAEGKLGGEFFTPRSIVRLLVEMLEPYEGRVYDPCCGSAGMFVQSRALCQSSRRAEDRHLDLRSGVEPDDLASRSHEPRNPWHRGQPWLAAF